MVQTWEGRLVRGCFVRNNLRREECSMEKGRVQAGSWNGALSLEFGSRQKSGGAAIVLLIPMGIFTCG